MKTFRNLAFQGDLCLRRIDALPAELQPVVAVDGKYIVAHSETGHHHWLADDASTRIFRDPQNAMICYLTCEQPTDLVHARPYDTHETLTIPGGIYELRRQREWAPEGWRRIED